MEYTEVFDVEALRSVSGLTRRQPQQLGSDEGLELGIELVDRPAQ